MGGLGEAAVAEHLAPALGEQGQSRIGECRRVCPVAGFFRGRLQRGGQTCQRHPVRFAARQRRHDIQPAPAPGYECFRQAAAELGVQCLLVPRVTAVSVLDEADQARPAGGLPVQDHGAGAPAQHGRRRGFHLFQFDAVAPQLDLVVAASQEVQPARVVPVPEVAGEIDPLVVQRVDMDESCRGGVRIADIALGQTGAGDGQFADRSGRKRAQGGVEDVDALAGQFGAEGDLGTAHQILNGDLVHGGADCRLGHSVDVEHPRVGVGEEGAQRIRRDALAAEDQQPRRPAPLAQRGP